ncbi:hypothetical protein DSL72_006002 [Monilinia vaccinii-corymbosi]|uniref:Uncharacterized protein n=1 Tax=Monilinia vaccinii-corymbosi TaxID=61207 RepID=A0A8A3PH74_9HELO|nr:hypothetical protein DSL72_006002 [Monilinia vaccinii-corymbosi]
MNQENNGPEYGSDGKPEESSLAPIGPYRVIYSDYMSARAARLARVEDAIEEANDRGLYDNAPSEPLRQQAYIIRLVNAFNSIETEGDDSIIDKPCKNGKLSQAALKFQQGRYPAWAIEEVCWEIFEKARIAQMDVRLLDIFHDAKFEGISIHATFGHRWTAIVDACARSKALCKMLLDAPYLERFVSHPQAELKMKLNNKKINAQRDEQNEIGRTFLSKGLGKEEAVEALAKLHPDAEISFDAFDNLGPRVGPVTPAAPVRIQPARAATSSTKRKREYDSDDEYDDDDDVYNDSAVRSSMGSSAKIRRPTLKTPTRSNIHNPVMDNTPQSKKANLTSTVSRERRFNEIAPRKSQAEMDAEAEERYKKIICNLLEIDGDNHKVRQYSLEELRYYARAYNGEFGGSTWTHRDYPGCSGLGYTFTDENNVVHDHFCRVIKSFMPLAKYRGDFLNSTLNMNHNTMFQPRSSTDREALGATANTFGFHVGYPAPVNIKSHGSPGMLTAKPSYTAPSPSYTAPSPITQTSAYPPYGQNYYPRQGTYNQSGLQYPSYSQTHGSPSYAPIPQPYGPTSRSYSQNNPFPQASLGSPQSFGPNSNYGAGYGYNSQSSGMYDHENSYAGRASAHASLRGVDRFATPHNSPAGYAPGFAAPSTDYSPIIGQSPANMTADHMMGSLGPTHHSAASSSEYPDPNECSNQTSEQ